MNELNRLQTDTRKIIHVDMDAFFASIEMRDRLELREKPIAVGGSPKGRGVVATANYQARRFGVKSAMPSAKAIKLCPELIFVSPRFSVYQTVSRDLNRIFRDYTPLVEMVSLDEAYLDVSDVCLQRSITATKLALEIKEDIYTQLQLTASTGVSLNKMLAKIASDLKKPNGISVITPDQVESFMRDLPLGRIPGIGPVTNRKLTALGLKFCGDCQPNRYEIVMKHFGFRFAEWLWKRAKGIDERQIVVVRQRKSLGKESTFSRNLTEEAEKTLELQKIGLRVARLLVEKKLGGRTLTLKIRDSEFRTITRSWTTDSLFINEETIIQESLRLFRNSGQAQRPIRLLGISISNLIPLDDQILPPRLVQQELFPS